MSELQHGALEDGFDDVLVSLRDGCDRTWTTLYDDLAPVVLGYLTAQRAPSPEDITAEVFLQVVRDLDSFSGTYAEFRSWVFTIAHHRLIDARRHRQRRPSQPEEDHVLVRILPKVEIEQDVLDAVTTDELELVLDLLTPGQRDVLYLKVVGGLNLVEVAEVLGKNHEAVRGLQKRALAALRDHLEDGPYPLAQLVALTRAT